LGLPPQFLDRLAEDRQLGGCVQLDAADGGADRFKSASGTMQCELAMTAS